MLIRIYRRCVLSCIANFWSKWMDPLQENKNIKPHARSCITDDTDFGFNCDLLTIIMFMSTILTGCKSNKTTDRSNYNHS